MNPDKISNEDYVVDNDEIMEDATQETNTRNDKDEQEIENVAPRNIPFISSTLDTFQLLSGWLKDFAS